MRSLVPWLCCALLAAVVMLQAVHPRRSEHPALPGATVSADLPPLVVAAELCPHALAQTRTELATCRSGCSALAQRPSTVDVPHATSTATTARPMAAPMTPRAAARQPSLWPAPRNRDDVGASLPADAIEPYAVAAVLEPALAELADVSRDDFLWLRDLTCVLRDQRRDFLAALERGEEPAAAWDRLRDERQEAVAAVTAFLGPERTAHLRDVGGMALVADAASCDQGPAASP